MWLNFAYRCNSSWCTWRDVRDAARVYMFFIGNPLTLSIWNMTFCVFIFFLFFHSSKRVRMALKQFNDYLFDFFTQSSSEPTRFSDWNSLKCCLFTICLIKTNSKFLPQFYALTHMLRSRFSMEKVNLLNTLFIHQNSLFLHSFSDVVWKKLKVFIHAAQMHASRKRNACLYYTIVAVFSSCLFSSLPIDCLTFFAIVFFTIDFVRILCVHLQTCEKST